MSDKILLVDDEVALLTAMRRLLSPVFHVDTAGSAREAVEIIRNRGPYAVVVSDLGMPGTTGIELLSQIRQSWPDTVGILLTGQVDIESTLGATDRGNIHSFLGKPCRREELTRALHGALAQYHLKTGQNVGQMVAESSPA